MANTYTKDNSSFIDIIKGYRRLTNAPLDSTSIFDSYNAASTYALAGASGGSAYVGQVLVVINDETNDNLNTIYTISSDYQLQKIVASNKSSQYYYYFTAATAKSDSSLITLPSGFIITKLTVFISEAFVNKSGDSVPFGISCVNVVTDDGSTVLADYNDFETDVANSKYIIEQQYKITSTVANITITFADLANLASGSGYIVLN